MCGICGFKGNGSKIILENMVKSIVHRGPDEAGFFEYNNVFMGMRRLSIIDVNNGQQPVFNEDKSIAVVFNGEIYNHQELREHLKSRGHSFYTDHSDTEVLVHLYEEYGDDFLHHLNGMFSIAIYNKNNDRLFLARDRVGIKPLYYSPLKNTFIFGSEIKALLNHTEISREPDFEAFHHYFSLKNIPAPFTAFKNIKQLHPGEYGVLESGEFKIKRWWVPNFTENTDITEKEAADKIYEILKDSVRLQMNSDVPYGAYLSGGVDSSAVVSLLSLLGHKNIDTFTLVYEDDFAGKTVDQAYAKQIADTLGTNHHEFLIKFKDVPGHIDNILKSFDEPYSGVTSTYFITECISKHVKVALSGDGADELFGSYKAHRFAQPVDYFRKGEFNLAQKNLIDSQSELEFLSSIDDEAKRRMELYISKDSLNRELYSDFMLDKIQNASTEKMVREILNKCNTKDSLNRILYLDFTTLLPDQVLSFVDKLSMAHSVEVRPPFLDHRLVEFVQTLPGHMKIKNGRVKHILKEAVKDLLPKNILDRKKEGFIMPVNEWILDSLEPYVRSIFAPNRIKSHGLFKQDCIDNLLHACYKNSDKKIANRIWNLMMFQLWWEKYIN